VLPATRQRRHSLPPLPQPKLALNLATPKGYKAELTCGGRRCDSEWSCRSGQTLGLLLRLLGLRDGWGLGGLGFGVRSGGAATFGLFAAVFSEGHVPERRGKCPPFGRSEATLELSGDVMAAIGVELKSHISRSPRGPHRVGSCRPSYTARLRRLSTAITSSETGSRYKSPSYIFYARVSSADVGHRPLLQPRQRYWASKLLN